MEERSIFCGRIFVIVLLAMLLVSWALSVWMWRENLYLASRLHQLKMQSMDHGGWHLRTMAGHMERAMAAVDSNERQHELALALASWFAYSDQVSLLTMHWTGDAESLLRELNLYRPWRDAGDREDILFPYLASSARVMGDTLILFSERMARQETPGGELFERQLVRQMVENLKDAGVWDVLLEHLPQLAPFS